MATEKTVSKTPNKLSLVSAAQNVTSSTNRRFCPADSDICSDVRYWHKADISSRVLLRCGAWLSLRDRNRLSRRWFSARGVNPIRRREFIRLFSSTVVAWPLTARAQQAAIPVIGLLGSATASDWRPYVSAFHQGLRDAGYVEGRNVAIEARWADSQYDRLPAMAAELVQRQVNVIVAFSTPAARAAKATTTTIPIVFTTNRDPVQISLVASLSRPGGNMTGATNLGVEVDSKLLELLHDAVPSARIIAVLVNPTNFNTETLSRRLQPAARTFGLQLHVLNASTERDFDTVFATLHQLRADGLVVVSDVLFTARSRQLAALTINHAVPAIYQDREFAAAGGLMSYTGSIPDSYRQAGVYTGRILKGEKPADLPVVQGTKFELVINLKTAKALGLSVPVGLLNAADEVIE